MKCNGLQIETAVQVDRGNDVSSDMPLSLEINKRHNRIYTHCKVGATIKSVMHAEISLQAQDLLNPLLGPAAPGVAAGVVGVTPGPLDEASAPFCC